MLRRLVLSVVLLACSGCSLLPSGDGPDALATQLAGALGTHSLTEVPLVRETSRSRHADLVAPLDGHPVQVTVREVEREGDEAEATLRWRWDLPGKAWTYDTTARLVNDGNRWEVDWAPSIVEPSLKDGERLGASATEGRRGRILGQGGEPLVEDRPVLRYGLDKTEVRPRQVAASARGIAAALDIDAATYVRRARAAGPKAFVEALVLRVEEARDSVDPAFEGIPGAVALEDALPLGPSRDFAAELLGRVGPATAEMVEESDGEIGPGDTVGLSGLQARYEEELAGEAGFEVVAVGVDDVRRRLFRVAPDHGTDLRTTLDPGLQLKAEETLASLGEDSPRSAIVAVRPSDGHVVAAANGPGNGGLNVATAGRYAPGSTFKVVTALALLRAGVAPGDVLSCTDTVQVDGRSFKNYDDYPADRVGDIAFSSAIAHSCNTALIAARDRLEGADLAEAAAALGLGVDHDLGFPAYFGQVPRPSGETEHAASLIGQGKVLASPMAMAAVAASVSGGRAVLPTLLPDHAAKQVGPEAPLTDEESRMLQEMLRGVVTEGSGRFLLDVPGEVGAKTGTAEYGAPGPDGELATHAWMIATRGDLAVAVFVETGTSGSGTAGPLLERFLR